MADTAPASGVVENGRTIRLRLYVAGAAPNSELARANLEALLARHAASECDVEIIDCIREPRRALADGVLVTPTLVRSGPGPARTIVGALTDAPRVVAALGLASGPSRHDPAAEERAHAG